MLQWSFKYALAHPRESGSMHFRVHGCLLQLFRAACILLLQAKAGVVGLTKTVAREWGAFNIRCNAIAYGFIATRLTGNKEEGATISVNGEKVQSPHLSLSLLEAVAC